MKVFISYAHLDEDKVNSILSIIHDDVYSWIDHKNLLPSHILDNSLKKGINEADFIIT